MLLTLISFNKKAATPLRCSGYVGYGNVGIVSLWLVGNRLYNGILCEPFQRIHGIKQTVYSQLVVGWQFLQQPFYVVACLPDCITERVGIIYRHSVTVCYHQTCNFLRLLVSHICVLPCLTRLRPQSNSSSEDTPTCPARFAPGSHLPLRPPANLP